MIKASKIKSRVDELKQIREELRISEEQKIKNDKINSELLEVEKAINKFNRDLSSVTGESLDKCKYIKVDMALSKDVKKILIAEGYFIDNLYTNETHLYFDKDVFDKVMAQHKSHKHDMNIPKYNHFDWKCGVNSLETENQQWGYEPLTEGTKTDKMSNLRESDYPKAFCITIPNMGIKVESNNLEELYSLIGKSIANELQF